jgi:hypothetical protein
MWEKNVDFISLMTALVDWRRKVGLFAVLISTALLSTTATAFASDVCGKGVLKDGTWTFACVDDKGRNLCYFCPSNQITGACSKTLGVCPS